MYRHFFKPLLDFILSLLAVIVLSPFFLLFTPIVAIAMKGNPFFVQPRPGKNGKIFKMIKYRTMTNAKDENGNLLPDADRLTGFGKMMRKLSIDELPEIFNILAGQMSIVGPRPLLVQYLPLYNSFQRRRHDVRPGLTGYAQVSGRNALTWNQKFEKDVYYVDHLSFWFDIKILFMTIAKVFKREGISQEGQATMEYFVGNKAINVLILSAGRRVELVKAFKSARDRLGVAGDVIAADMDETAPTLFFADKKTILPRVTDASYLEQLIATCINDSVSLIVPTIDTELEILAQNKEIIESQTSARVMISDLECVSVCCDKQKTACFFAENGINAPITYSDINEAKKAPLPLFIKPRDGSSSINAFKVTSYEQLEFLNSYIDEPVIQECVKGTEYTFDIFADFVGRIISIVPRKRIAVRGGEILKGQIDMDDKLIAQARKVVDALKPIGHITIQGMKDDDGTVKFIEINPRFGGGAPMSISAGADSCEWLYRILNGEEVTPADVNVQDGVVFSRFDDSVRVK